MKKIPSKIYASKLRFKNYLNKQYLRLTAD